MKTVLRVAILVVCALTGLWVTIHGIAEVALIHTLAHENIMQNLAEGSISVAGGACVLAVAVEQLECMRTRRKSGGIL
jgi:hypothetical protein